MMENTTGRFSFSKWISRAISGPTNTVRIFKLDSEGNVIIDE